MLPLLAGVSKWDGIYWCWAYIFPLTLKSHSRLYAWDLCTYVHQKKSSRVSIAVRFIITPLETLQMPISILHCGIFTWQIVDIIEIPKPPLHTITGWISWTKLSKRNQTTKNTRTPFNLYKVQEQAKLIYGDVRRVVTFRSLLRGPMKGASHMVFFKDFFFWWGPF